LDGREGLTQIRQVLHRRLHLQPPRTLNFEETTWSKLSELLKKISKLTARTVSIKNIENSIFKH
jgi:hypothetical protein